MLKSSFRNIAQLSLLLIFSLFINSCQNTVEVVEEVYEDNSPKLVRFYDKKTNEVIKEVSYYPDHKIKLEGHYKNSQRDGIWTYYYDNGNKWSEAVYTDGINNGKTTTWYENGKMRYEGQYAEGEKIGNWKFWTEDGELAEEINY
ncbi:MAG: hypothetical protein PHT69_08045 [Bacteroidales bacterium]|nr:hypothetical protein [Bacteroidales bacterium]